MRKSVLLVFALLLCYLSLGAEASWRDESSRNGRVVEPRAGIGNVFHFPRTTGQQKRFMRCTWGCASGTGGSATVMDAQTCSDICAAACHNPCAWA